MKIAVIPSNNGLGHIKRCSIIANELSKKNKVHFYSPQSKTKKFKFDKKIKLINFNTKINFNSKYFKNNKAWINKFLKNNYYDIYFSDNLPELAYLKKNFFLYANFFWHHLFKKKNPNKSKEIDNLIVNKKVTVFSDKLFVSKEILKKFNPVLIDIVGSKLKKKKIKKKGILFSFGTSNYIEKKNILKFLIKERKNLKKNFSKVYVDKMFYDKMKDLSLADYKNNMFHNIDCAIVKPGLGIVTDCIKRNIKIITYVKNQNEEFKNNSLVLNKVFKSHRSKSLAHAIKHAIKNKNINERNKKIKFNGEKKIAKLILGNYN